MKLPAILLFAALAAGAPLNVAPLAERDSLQLSPDVYYDFLFMINDNGHTAGSTEQLVMLNSLNTAAQNKAQLATALRFDTEKLPFMDTSGQTWMITSASDVGSVITGLRKNGKISSELKRSKYQHVGVGNVGDYWVVVLEK